MRPSALLSLAFLAACDMHATDDTADSRPPPVDADGDGFDRSEDCDDGNPAVNPGISETCDGIDNDCDGFVDDEDPDLAWAPRWYPDADGDGWGDEGGSRDTCAAPSGWVEQAGDCDDGDASIHPGAEEDCDGVDDDCNGEVDDAPGATLSWADEDGDGWGTDERSAWLCEPEAGWVEQAGDCDDGDASIHPEGVERCNGLDDDCDGEVDEDDAVDPPTWWEDGDGDGYGTDRHTTAQCEQPSGYVAAGADPDCDDGDPQVHPDARETCNGVDDDCNGYTDDEPVDGATWYRDGDGDGYGSATASRRACSQPSGYVANATDCDDAQAGINPGALERCDGADNDCDGTTDEGTAVDAQTWYRDADGDGFGDPGAFARACSLPSGYSALSSDCDDGAASIHPFATEFCDGVDQDCDGDLDDDQAVTFTDASGTPYDLSATFRAGSAASPVAYAIASSGTLSFCRGRFYATLTASAAQVVVLGLYGSDQTAISAASSGAILSAGSASSDLQVEGLTFEDGSIAGSGGAIQALVPGLALTVTDCVFEGNEAADGGAIAADSASLILDACSFADNAASGNGGAVWAADSALEVYDTQLLDNEANLGGAFFLTGGSLLLDQSLVQGNNASAVPATGTDVAGGGGGAFLEEGATLTCSAVGPGAWGFLANLSPLDGGAVSLSSGTSLSSALCDWGADGGSTDNGHADIWVSAANGAWDYGDDQTFTCTDLGCF